MIKTPYSLRARRYAWLLPFVLLGWFSLAHADGQAFETGAVVTRSYDFEAAGKEMEYALFVPSSYDAETPTPLVVLLHGLGSNPQQVIGYEGITDEAEARGFIVVAPYGYNERGWYGSRGSGKDFNSRRYREEAANDPENLGELSEKDVLNVLDVVRDELNVDPARTYLMGHSMGGGGTLYLGMKYSDNWAALAPMSPAIWSDPDELADVADMPIIIVQGEEDRLVPVDGTRRWVAKMDELGMDHVYIEIEGGNHFDSITRNPDMMADVFDFLSSHTK